MDCGNLHYTMSKSCLGIYEYSIYPGSLSSYFVTVTARLYSAALYDLVLILLVHIRYCSCLVIFVSLVS
jgi:hypothetical protein